MTTTLDRHDTGQEQVEAPRAPVTPEKRPPVRWMEWVVRGLMVVILASIMVFVGSQPSTDTGPTADLVLSDRSTPAVPEFLGASGGDMVAFESSPLVLSDRSTPAVPEFVGQSGGDLPADETSGLTIGPRHDGVTHTPEYVGGSGGGLEP